tara:strand:+ start:1764 stop:2348 length:585 start_codon:yes stop_codon:yes gene_type:complete
VNFKDVLLGKNKKLMFFILFIIGVIFLLYESTESKLIKKLNNNSELIQKFKEFKLNGYEKDIELPNEIINSVIDTAETYLGVPNKVGGISKDGIDASGLIFIAITRNSEFKFPRIAQDMARYGTVITNTEKLKRGDLVFFYDTYETDRIITSAGIYLGENKFLNSSSNNGVSVSDINDPFYWNEKFFFGTRIFK